MRRCPTSVTMMGWHEIDFIIHRGHAEAVGVEVKLKSAITDHDVRHLLWLKESLPDQIVDLVVINTGGYAYRRQDGVAVVPSRVAHLREDPAPQMSMSEVLNTRVHQPIPLGQGNCLESHGF